ncbi:hypothetical protein ACFQ5J_05405 [Lacticaseibacillus baoqingensis]|uniref:Uncharacterized protein n=1 Tax=Lacticaseibacillus baoqingensis TaxID=2486013 RepID=A0ABW4E7F5_9LACO|nr:hypothetical protein [Lacticaseibacillus baoqingensis]
MASTPKMSLQEFDGYMREGGFKYSLLVIAELDEAADHMQLAKRDDSRTEYARAYAAQLDALETAEFEKQHGQVIEPVLDYLPSKAEKWLRETEKKWQGYLAKIR